MNASTSVSVPDFFRLYNVKRPAKSVTKHDPKFVHAQIRNLQHLLSQPMANAHIRAELLSVQKDWEKISASLGPVFNLDDFMFERKITSPNAFTVASAEEVDEMIGKIREAQKNLPENAPPWIFRKLGSFVYVWGQIKKNLSFDTSRSETKARPAKYLAKKAQHRAESQAIRQRMQTSKGKK